MPYAGRIEEYKNRKTPLFHLADGTPVFFDDVLWHPDRRRVGWCCIARFTVDPNGETVTVNSPNGAVPKVRISELRREPPKPATIPCPVCNGTGRINTWL